MYFSFEVKSDNLFDFINHWSSKYYYSQQEKYDDNIKKPFNLYTRSQLFEWKNGSKISEKKQQSIKDNYPLSFKGDYVERYLNHKKPGGAIWNIFYLHCLEPDRWPIYDQHTHRAMAFMKSNVIKEIGTTNKQKFASYQGEYMPFFEALKCADSRKKDKALFAFGQFLKIANRYV